VKARRLWDAFGDDLYRVLDDGDVDSLSKHVNSDVASSAIEKWAIAGNGSALKWMQDIGLDVKIGRKVLEFHGTHTPERLSEDPYRLLSFSASWRKVDEIACGTFGMAPDDPRRILGAVEEACYAAFAEGHTFILTCNLMSRIHELLGSNSWPLVSSALDVGSSNGSFVVGTYGVQPTGAAAMEHVVARFICQHVRKLSPLVSSSQLAAHILEYEGISGLILNSEQRSAVGLVNSHPISLVTGGAGVGKTTVLKAMYGIYDSSKTAVIQMALAGRAAKRMEEATGRPASTIAKFLHRTKPGDLTGPTVLLIDEASMLDIASMSAVCERLSPTTRLVLLGDPHQLMPVGPGLVLHALVGVDRVPHVELTTVKRYGGAVLKAANSIRAGKWPVLGADVEAPISFIPCDSGEHALAEVVVDLYGLNPENTQVLVSKLRGRGGAHLINAMAQRRFTVGNPPVFTVRGEFTGLHVGDPILCTRNIWERGLQNGSMGVISRVEEIPTEQFDDLGRSSGYAMAWVKWDDGITRPLVEGILDDVTLGYAITVHKAQGSQWRRVVVPVVGNRILDRALLYTAVTRAEAQVILLGDAEAARNAVEGLPRSSLRDVALDLTLSRLLDERAKGDAA
jgi:exodeoxyribonuclease V alpha subunit